MKNDRPVVLVTGASGFVGGHLAGALESNGWAVRRVVRTPKARPNDVLIETIGHATDWQNALVGVDAVVHLAARVHHPNDVRDGGLYRDINIDGTLHLARCAANVGVRQFVFLSSILVNGRNTDARDPFRESDIPTPSSVYGMSKATAEVGLKEMSQGSSMCITVIRPPMIYGSGAKGNFKLLCRAVEHGIPLPFGLIQNRRAFLSIQNLNSFILERLAHASGRFDVFLVADDEQVSTPEFIRRIAGAAGNKARLFPMPIFILSRLLKVSGRPEMNESIIGSLDLDVSKAASTGWRPQVTLDEGLRLAMINPG